MPSPKHQAATDKATLWNMLLTALLLVSGLALTATAAIQVSANSFQLWQLAAIAEAERLSTELRYRVLRNREPLIAVGSLYSGSDEVTQDELLAAHRQLVEITGLEVGHSLAFVIDNNNPLQPGYVIAQSAGELELLPAQPGADLNPLLIPAIEAARNNQSTLTTGALFRVNDTSYLPITLTSANNNQPGTLIFLLDFTQLINILTEDVLLTGTTLRVYHPVSGELNHANLPALQTAPEASHVIEVDMGLYAWQLEWLFDSDYDTTIDDRLVYFIVIGGTLITLLLCFIIYTLLQQRHVVRQQILKKTRELMDIQQQLVQKEKMAALGNMVAGISHELNTPIGNTLLTATLLKDRSKALAESMTHEEPDREMLEDYLYLASESSRLIESNAQRASSLISSFKQVAVDQSSERRRPFTLDETLEEISYTLKPTLKSSKHKLLLSVPKNISMDSYPGALYQIISNLVSNSITHAFPAEYLSQANTTGSMLIKVTKLDKDQILMQFSDDGVGISHDIRHRVFDPFFTTRMGSGGSGLGLHIVFSLVTETLGGKISLQDTDTGCLINIQIPRVAPSKES